MPPRLTITGSRALRTNSSQTSTLFRPFSSTTTLSAARDPQRPPPPSSSTARLLTLNDDRPAPSSGTGGDAAARLLNRFKDRADVAARQKQAQIDLLREQKTSADYLKQMPRFWRAGDIYSPHDLSATEMQKWRRKSPRNTDVVDSLGLRPLDMYTNFALIEEFTHSSGQIKHSSMTRLRPVNQRKIAKMIRRVQGMGLYPTIHDHPELIRHDFFPFSR